MTLPPPKKPKSGWIPVSSDQLRKPGQSYQREAPAPSEKALKRAAQTHQLQIMGTPLTQQIQTYRKASNNLPMLTHGAAIAGSGTGVVLSVVLGAPTIVPIVAGAACIYFAFQLASKIQKPSLMTEIDIASRFDQCLADSAPRLPLAIRTILQDIKSALAQLLPNLPLIREQQLLSQQDMFYISQAAQQYVPEALQVFLAIPQEGQTVVIDLEGKSAEQILAEQLQLIANKLAQLQQQLLQQHGQKLLVQKRFLQEKS